MTFEEAIKRLRQETVPATYCPDFDKEECLKVIEKENELLKEILKILFGIPLTQFTDKRGELIIETDSACSYFRLGKFKGVDLDNKLKEILNDYSKRNEEEKERS